MNRQAIIDNYSQASENHYSSQLKTTKKVRILDTSFDALSLAQTVDWVVELIKSGQKGYICTVNVAILMMMRSYPQLRNFVHNAALVVADGQPLVWTSKLLEQQLPERVTGIDLIDAIAARAEKEGLGIYLMGATAPVIAAAAFKMQSKYPRLKICGFDDGYFNEAQSAERAAAISQSGAQILFVGMGVPRQESFLEQNWDELGINLAIPVGGSFDVYAGLRKRAPLWVQQTGLEWLYRLIQEPQRLWKRYLLTNSQFVLEILRSMFTRSHNTTVLSNARERH
ncbi:WecB/TagA/CpsF family glycosyltransferase [Calothrix sp. PCC 7507]|uniref:WecB/TagA/CpsF family glycosyltransferase n=1 Tax=Calothrix sp. PCC 7507 TaxID=99598 RepID=UPI00029EEB05|nr:WecB/TagA/CpsF family glycosyltransferase [Calothrix sp. PCC 7507]AFY34997.1 glycosyl transferase, WecB/TagA/CpsF family [Calothrix sp. PCC 7507]